MAQPGPGQPPAPTQPPQGPSPAEAILSKAHEGLMQVSELFEKGGQAIPPADHEKLASIITAYQSLVEDLSGNGQPEQPQQPAPGPMDANAGPDSKPY